MKFVSIQKIAVVLISLNVLCLHGRVVDRTQDIQARADILQNIQAWWHRDGREDRGAYKSIQAQQDRVSALPGYGRLDSDLYSG